MIIGTFDESVLHFGCHYTRTPLESLEVHFDPGDVLMIEKNSFADVWFKHGINRHDVKGKRTAFVMRLCNTYEEFEEEQKRKVL